jgi:hypothetical protein
LAIPGRLDGFQRVLPERRHRNAREQQCRRRGEFAGVEGFARFLIECQELQARIDVGAAAADFCEQLLDVVVMLLHQDFVPLRLSSSCMD